ncbi:phenylalanine--tRNA ligase subunit alpha [Candidatus Parcubacteria bacterium]|nr:phenylalanine--tRNA ligase subunit alpha [Candidatus Parcubacteria bacterium]
MEKEILKIKEEILAKAKKIKDPKFLRDLETKYMGRKGEFTKILRSLSKLNDEDKKKVGRLANTVKREIALVFTELKNTLEGGEKGESFVDVTLPGIKMERGHKHPISLLTSDLEDIFTSMGFMVLDGPELESDFFNFEALNIPKTHPARDMQDTFYIDKPNKNGELDLVMRTQTSPVQIRAMREYGAPLKCVVPGRVFRNEAIDAVHDTTFDQFEGFMIGDDISLCNLIAVLKEMLSGVFKQEVKVRVRPGYFPFVEPGIEVDMSCTICGGSGCPSCKQVGWLEMIGAGMIHPKVLEYGGIDSKKYSGFAFGMGVTRLAMMKYGIDDIRLFNGSDMKFLKQF